MSVFGMEESGSAVAGKLRRERRSDRPIPKIVPDRRKYRRVPVTLHGRLMAEDKQEYPCEVVDMSAGGMALLAPVSCQPGERIVAYLENLGRLEGTVARTFEGGFAVELKTSTQKRERIANLLTWYTNRDYLDGQERQHERFEPRIATQKLILPNGDGGTAQGDVNHTAVVNVAIWQDQLLRGDARLKALMLPRLTVKIVAVGVPGQQIGDALTLLGAGLELYGETPLERARHGPLEPAEIFEIGDDSFARLAGDRGQESHAAGRHVDDLARVFLLVLSHQAAVQRYRHAAIFTTVRHDLGNWTVAATLSPEFSGYRGPGFFHAEDTHALSELSRL